MFESLPEIVRTHYSRCWVQRGALDTPHNAFYSMLRVAKEAVYEVQKDVIRQKFDKLKWDGRIDTSADFIFFKNLIIRSNEIMLEPNLPDDIIPGFFSLYYCDYHERDADHERFCVTESTPKGFDLAVASILIVAKSIFPEKILLPPNQSQWVDALEIAKRVNAPVESLPSRIPSDRLW